MGFYGTEGATIRIEPSGKVNVYVAGGSTGNSLETTVVQLAADALGVDIDDVATIQGDTAVTPFGAGTGGSRSGSMIAGRGRRGRRRCSARRSWRSPPITSRRPRPTSSWSTARAIVRGTPSVGVTLAELADDRVLQTEALPPGMAAGLEASAPVHRAGAHDLGQRHPRVHLRGRSGDRAR